VGWAKADAEERESGKLVDKRRRMRRRGKGSMQKQERGQHGESVAVLKRGQRKATGKDCVEKV
jgi:hypothetical protein